MVVRVATSGATVGGSACAGAEITVEAGENWDALVAAAVAEEWIGVEALSGIPGTVGAVPIQNVGAYGQEVAETIVAGAHLRPADGVRGHVRAATAASAIAPASSSVSPGGIVVGAVTFQFRLGNLGAPVAVRASWRGRLGVEVGRAGGVGATCARRCSSCDAARAWCSIPADHDTWSAGSFFTNPFVAPDCAARGRAGVPAAGRHGQDECGLADRAGRFQPRDTAPSGSASRRKHTLALTNRGAATTGGPA